MAEENSIAFETVDDVTVARVHMSELTAGLADAVLTQFGEAIKAGRPAKLVLDLTNISFIDSIALGTLVVLLRRVKQDNGALALAGLSGHALKVLQVTGLAKVFDLHGDVSSAVSGLKTSG